ncbi:BamA/TamA family outer membrane protein [Microscilla marina]|uniref:Surface antigen variable number repeat domain protein n=1 Tax=Microscilla marina ATCC 23134 TaxID=313606 RepID=A1ZYG7_MICM2|nr:BamA/TamA family outer membrane protein [Microscilla marina]EAY24551.1 surface antigen variable number repeat domain protein [Microscilla marina ATCC 23134]
MFLALLSFILDFCLLSNPCLPQPHAYPASCRVTPASDSTKATPYTIIRTITITGNKKTKRRIILRELDVHPGDSLLNHRIDTVLLSNKNKIFNTNLFITVDLSLQNKEGNVADLHIKLKERWYFFPAPLFELVDRNFNEWWHQRNRDLTRVRYGLRLTQDNVFGLNQKLELLFLTGFINQYSLSYRMPYIDRAQKMGLSFQVSYTQNKSIPYRTEGHQLDFLESEKILKEQFSSAVSLRRRSKFYDFHTIALSYHQSKLADTIPQINPLYFLDGKNTQKYFKLQYTFEHNKTDINAYPLNGSIYRGSIEKYGLGFFNDVDMLATTFTMAKYKRLGRGFFADVLLRGRYLLHQRQPYSISRGLGYGNNLLRGYEFYVLDGQHFVLNRNTLKFRFVNTRKELGFIPIPQFRTLPLAMYFTFYFDTGYVSDRFFTEINNRFTNRFIYGTGVGVDIVTYYNMIIRCNYALNSGLEHGFYITFSADL